MEYFEILKIVLLFKLFFRFKNWKFDVIGIIYSNMDCFLLINLYKYIRIFILKEVVNFNFGFID